MRLLVTNIWMKYIHISSSLPSEKLVDYSFPSFKGITITLLLSIISLAKKHRQKQHKPINEKIIIQYVDISHLSNNPLPFRRCSPLHDIPELLRTTTCMIANSEMKRKSL